MKRSIEESETSSISEKRSRTEETPTLEVSFSTTEVLNDYKESDFNNLEDIKSLKDITLVERQIIQKSLAMIRRANESDWNFEVEDDCRMFLSENCIVEYNKKRYLYNIITEIIYESEVTRVIIRYDQFYGNSKYITLFWTTEECYCKNCKSDKLFISKRVSKWIFWEQDKTFQIIPYSDTLDNWCYFADTRRHLNRLVWFEN